MLYGPRAHKSFVLHPPPHAITCEDPHRMPLCISNMAHLPRRQRHAYPRSRHGLVQVPGSSLPRPAECLPLPLSARLSTPRAKNAMATGGRGASPSAFESVAVGAVQGTAPAAPPSSGACSSAMTAAYRSASLPVLRFVRTISPNLATVSASGSFSRARTARMAERTSSL